MTDNAAPEWAFKRVQDLSAPLSTDPDFEVNERFPTVRAFARYIAQHEQPPVDPDLLLARECAADACERHNSVLRPDLIRSGDQDEGPIVKACLAAIRAERARIEGTDHA